MNWFAELEIIDFNQETLINDRKNYFRLAVSDAAGKIGRVLGTADLLPLLFFFFTILSGGHFLY